MERRKAKINNSFYDTLEDRWLSANDHPIALLRAENAARIPWILQTIKAHCKENAAVLDIGCGAGFLTNRLAQEGYRATGIDLSLPSLEIAKKNDETKRACYLEASADALPFDADTFDVVSALDLLEHVENPEKVIQEASRVLKPGGLFFFHTFNRNWISWLIVIKGVEWCVKDTPKNMHVYNLFLTPKEVEEMCKENSITVELILGLRPDFIKKSFWQMLLTRKVPSELSFCFTSSLKTGYLGFGRKI